MPKQEAYLSVARYSLGGDTTMIPRAKVRQPFGPLQDVWFKSDRLSKMRTLYLLVVQGVEMRIVIIRLGAQVGIDDPRQIPNCKKRKVGGLPMEM